MHARSFLLMLGLVPGLVRVRRRALTGRPRWRRATLPAAVAVLALGACWSARSGPAPQAQPEPRRERADIRAAPDDDAGARTGQTSSSPTHPIERHPAETMSATAAHSAVDCGSHGRSSDLEVHLDAPPPDVLRDAALGYVGVAYTYGGTGPDGLDCSGLVNRIYARFGYDLPRTSREQAQVGVPVGRAELAVGDLLFFHRRPGGGGGIGHVAFSLGGDEFVHAASGEGRVRIDHLSSPWYGDRFAWARRIVDLPPGRYSEAAPLGPKLEDPRQIARRLGEVQGTCREDPRAGR